MLVVESQVPNGQGEEFTLSHPGVQGQTDQPIAVGPRRNVEQPIRLVLRKDVLLPMLRLGCSNKCNRVAGDHAVTKGDFVRRV